MPTADNVLTLLLLIIVLLLLFFNIRVQLVYTYFYTPPLPPQTVYLSVKLKVDRT